MLAGGLIMTAAGTLRGEWSTTFFFTTRTTAAMLYLSTIGAVGEGSSPTRPSPYDTFPCRWFHCTRT